MYAYFLDFLFLGNQLIWNERATLIFSCFTLNMMKAVLIQ